MNLQMGKYESTNGWVTEPTKRAVDFFQESAVLIQPPRQDEHFSGKYLPSNLLRDGFFLD